MILGYEVTTSGEGDYGQMTWRFQPPAIGKPTLLGGGTRHEVFTLDERDVTITFPSHLSSNSFEDLRGYLELFVKKMQRRAVVIPPTL